MNTVVEKNGGRDPSVDAFRGLAIASVIMIHTTADYAYADAASLTYGLMNLINKVFQFAVPAFVALTVFLALKGGRRRSPLYFLRKAAPVAGLYLLWTAFYLFLQNRLYITPYPDLKTFVLYDVLQGAGCYHLYYVVMLVLLYLIIPLLSLIPIKRLRPSVWLLGGAVLAQLAVVAVSMKYVIWPLGLYNTAIFPTFYIVPITLGLLLAADCEAAKRYFRDHAAVFGVIWGMAMVANAWFAANGGAVFAGRPMHSDLWSTLFTALNTAGGVPVMLLLAEKLKNLKPLRLLGRHTLTVYFAHPLALTLMDYFFNFHPGSPFRLLTGVGIKAAVTLALALIYSLAADKCNNLFKNLRQRRNKNRIS